MPLWRWPDVPAPVKAQVDRFAEGLSAQLGENLVGLYLHGSLALGCPNPAPKDIDLIAVSREPLTTVQREALASLLLALSGAPRPLEFHLLTMAQLHPWSHPAACDFHYSDAWRERFELGAWPKGDLPDRDLAAHLTVMRHAGAVIAGPPVAELFPPVPRQDYLDALLFDYGDCLEQLQATPVYSLLNICRILAFLRDGLILSKEEGGLWGLTNLPPNPHGEPVAQALAEYRGGAGGPYDARALTAFASYADGHVQRLLSEHTG